MAVHCRACGKGDHADCTRYLVRDHPCTCVCDDAPRQLSLPFGNVDLPAVGEGSKARRRADSHQDHGQALDVDW